MEHIDEMGATPWFVHFCCLRPHPPMAAPAPYDAMYDPARMPPPRRPADVETVRRQHPWIAAEIERQPLGEHFAPGTTLAAIGDDDDAAMRAAYYGNCSEVDTQVGRIMAHLKAQGLYDDTLIVFTSDHGDELGDNWVYGRRGYFDGHFHMPLIVRDPRSGCEAMRGRRVDAFVELIDLMPTILAALGAGPPASCDGHDLAPFLRGETPPRWRRAAFWELDFRDPVGSAFEDALGLTPDQCQFAVLRGERYKYIHFPNLAPVLFDLEKDPAQTVNVAAEDSYAAVVAQCAGALLSRRMEYAARGLTGYHQPYGTTEPPAPLA